MGTVRKVYNRGRFSAFYQAHRFRDALHSERIEADEIWSFIGAKKKNARQPGHGNLWTYTSIDPDMKLMVAWAVGERGPATAHRVRPDLADRVAGRIPSSPPTRTGATSRRSAPPSATGSTTRSWSRT